MSRFLLGAFVGAAAMWIWGDEMRQRFGAQVDALVSRALDVLDAFEDRVGVVRERLEDVRRTPGTASLRSAGRRASTARPM